MPPPEAQTTRWTTSAHVETALDQPLPLQRPETRKPTQVGLRVGGFFSGIGGFERGLQKAGHSIDFLCEIDTAAQRVLKEHFADVRLEEDVRRLADLPHVDLVAAGFPCQDLSQAGRTAGIKGDHSGIVQYVLDLVREGKLDPRWLLFENVPFMLHLNRGEAMWYLIRSLERLGFSWAYRIIDTRAFGVPQRRQRVFLLASRTEDPSDVLLANSVLSTAPTDAVACGFYWTEGNTGLGWAVDAVPPLKGGSGLTIPSPPGIWIPAARTIVTPDIRDAERLQGFEPDWTLTAISDPQASRAKHRAGIRWRLVGNAVSVPVAEWLGRRFLNPEEYDGSSDEIIDRLRPLPHAAWGKSGEAHIARSSVWPVCEPYQHLATFLSFPAKELSARATKGFYERLTRSNLRREKAFVADLGFHLRRMSESAVQMAPIPLRAPSDHGTGTSLPAASGGVE